MDGTRDYHTKWSKSDKDKYCMISLISGIQKVMLTNLCAKQKQTHRHRDQTCRCPGRGGGWGREGWEFGISRCKLVYIPILRDGPAYSTGSDIQHPLINHNGKHKRMPIWPNHSSAQHKLTQPWKSTTRQLEEKIHIMLASSCHHLTQNASVTFHSTSNKAPSTSLTLQSPVCGRHLAPVSPSTLLSYPTIPLTSVSPKQANLVPESGPLQAHSCWQHCSSSPHRVASSRDSGYKSAATSPEKPLVGPSNVPLCLSHLALSHYLSACSHENSAFRQLWSISCYSNISPKTQGAFSLLLKYYSVPWANPLAHGR